MEKETLCEQQIFQDVFIHSCNPIIILTKDLAISNVNNCFEDYSGYKKVEMEGKKNLTEFIIKEDLEKLKENHCIYNTGIKKTDLRFINRQGNMYNFRATSRFLNRKFVLITLWEQSEEINRQQKTAFEIKKLQTIFDSISDGICVVDRNYRLQFVNRGMKHIFRNYSKGKIRKKEDEFDFLIDDCISNVGFLEKVFFDGKPQNEMRVIDINENDKHVFDIAMFPIYDENGNVGQVIEYFKDVTYTLKLEDQLLYHERMAGIGELASGIAHEIRNPLANISASANYLMDNFEIEEKLSDNLRIILKNSEHANKIISDLLNFSKPKEYSFNMECLGEIIDSSCNMITTRCLKQHVRLTKKIFRKKLPMVFADRNRLQEAFLNLFSNSLDAMPNGGKLTIFVSPNFDEKEISINISDTGNGIPKEDINKIFDLFFTMKEKGTGIGLCWAKQIIDQHKGRIEIESKVNFGTTVKIRMPIKR